MLEHDAKELLRQRGVRVPPGLLARARPPETPPFPAPWIVKAQAPTGGRGKAGGVRRADSPRALAELVDALIGMSINGHRVRECRIEAAIEAEHELYLSFSIDPALAAIRILLSPEGGVDVEEHASETLLSGLAPPDPAALRAEMIRLTRSLPQSLVAPGVRDAARTLADCFLALDAALLEINPLFLRADGSWVAGDAKLIIDDNALPRQEAVRRLLEHRGDVYPDTVFKLEHGFDFVVMDPEGEIGLVTTGAGLSMQLIDELTDQGARPYNFCDIRSGQMRGDPARLIGVLRQMAGAPRLRSVLVNIFAGVTNLAEFAALLIEAVMAVPELAAPIVARLVGNGEAEAAAMIRRSGLPIVLEPDLGRAAALARQYAHADSHA